MTFPIATEAVVAVLLFQGFVVGQLTHNLGQQCLHIPRW